MHTSDSAPLMGRRTGAPWYTYDEARPRDIVRLDKRRLRRFEAHDLAADLADDAATEPFEDRAEDTDFDHDLLALAFDPWDDVIFAALDATDRADEAARLRAERILDIDALDIDAICGWDAPTTLIWSDWTDNSIYQEAT